MNEIVKPKVVVIMPAYNAARTLKMTYMELPHEVVDLVLLVDDGSTDQTTEVARELGLEIFLHNRNYGYGANQKTCYTEEKYRLMAGAKVLMMPSQNESFSFVTLEAMAQQTPVLASGGSEVLVDHMIQSGAGETYNDYQSFARALSGMLGDEYKSAEMGKRGKEYVTSHFDFDRIRASLFKVIAENELIAHHPVVSQDFEVC